MAVLFLLAGKVETFAQTGTHYYKQIKVVTKDRKEQAGNNQGQFITFTNSGCYDSDKSGFSVNNGFLKFGKKTTDRTYYSGDSYWGNAMYIFTENFNRLNILVETTGTTYVYVKATAPASAQTSALIKETKPNTTATQGQPSSTMPPNMNMPPQQKQELCNRCGGSGQCPRPVAGKSYCSSGRVYCTVCVNGKVSNPYNGNISRCTACDGVGWTICSTCSGSGKCPKCFGAKFQ